MHGQYITYNIYTYIWDNIYIYILSTSCRAGDGKAAVENDQRQDIKI